MLWENNHIITQNTLEKPVDFLRGTILLIDKPMGWTSFDVVNKLRFSIRHVLGIKKIKVGHAGTLDPLATGLLVVCTGKYTKLIDTFQAWEKVYSGSMKLGATTPTYDAEAEEDAVFPTSHITQEMIQQAAKQFTGEIQQIPPAYSAVKVEGQAAYTLARKGKDVVLKSRNISIYEFNTTFSSLEEVLFLVRCSKGTYIRSLAHDFGLSLGSGAYLRSLRRESIGEWNVSDALSVEEAHQWINGMEKGHTLV